MARKLIPVFCLVAFLFLSAGPVFAEAVVVKGDKIFIADNGLSVLNIADGLTADCSADLVTVAGDTISGATDVVVTDDGTAVVTVGEAGSIIVETVDVSACLGDVFDVDIDECVATIDIDDGLIEIPCVFLNGVVYEIHMEQRGNSSNWKISFADENDDMLDYRHGNDNDNDDNSNGNDD